MIRQNLNLSEFDNIFCDSAESLKWAYKNGLSRNTIIRTSSPALLWKGDNNIVHVESCWNVNKMRDFQSTIQGFSDCWCYCDD